VTYVDKIWHGNLLSGTSGTNQTLDVMAALVRRDAGDLQIRNFALSLASSCSGHDFNCEIEQLYSYARDQIIYRRDPVEWEWVQDAKRTIFVFGSGDCDDKVVALATLLAALGHRTRFVVLGLTTEKYTHVYLEVLTSRGWIPLDPTPEQASAGWEAKGRIRSTYEIFGERATSNFPLVIVAGLLAWWLMK
jgi:hypothetical protein